VLSALGSPFPKESKTFLTLLDPEGLNESNPEYYSVAFDLKGDWSPRLLAQHLAPFLHVDTEQAAQPDVQWTALPAIGAGQLQR
jgi:hypothetical protein